MIKHLFNNILRYYEDSDYLYRGKITVVFSVTFFMTLIAGIYLCYWIYDRRYDPGLLIPVSACFVVGLTGMFLIKKGYFYLSGHIIFALFFASIWAVLFLEDAPMLQTMDTFILTIALLSMTPFLVVRSTSFIIIWYALDLILLYLFAFTVGPHLGLSGKAINEYLMDTSMALVATAILSYLHFSFTTKAIDRARESENKLTEKNRELLSLNEELFESMEHLERMNEKYASQNRALANARDEIIRREETMSGLLRAMPMGVATVRERSFQWVNDKLCEITGYSYMEFMNLDARDLYLDMEEFERVGSKTLELENRGDVLETETHWIKKSGEIIPVILRGSWINPDHPEEGYIVTIIDNTEKVTTLDELHESRSMYKLLAENITDVIWAVGRDMKINYISPSVTDLYGFSPEEAREKTLRDWVPLDRYRYLADHLKNFLMKNDIPASGPDWSVREILPQVHKDGHRFWVEVILNLIRDSSGRPIGVVGVTRDITRRVEAESLAGREQARLGVTLESITEGVISTDLTGKVMLMNRTAEKMTGHAFTESGCNPVDMIYNPLNPATGRSVSSIMQVLQTGQTSDNGEKLVLSTDDGREIRITETCSPLKSSDGAVIGAVIVFRDVTEREIWERERLKMQQIESLGVLAGGIAHDFNNILSGILGNISLARMEGISDSERIENITEAAKAAELARRLTSQLLTFARGGSPVRENSSIKEIVNESVSFALRGSGVRADFMIQDDLWPGNVDRGQISQVIHNLTLNAMQAMEGSGTIDIQAENQVITIRHNLPLSPGRYLRISIGDTGRGISSDNIDRIFEPYFTTRSEGQGLGLSVVYSIITRHGGHIAVESKPGHGTTFTMWLPAAEGNEIQNIIIGGDIRMSDLIRVLLMDDDPSVRSVSARMLKSLGCEVITSTNGEEAMETFAREIDAGRQIDLVILDITVPGGMGGRETLENLRRIEPGIKAIASSGYSNDSLMAEYRSWGFTAVLAKPYNREELSGILESTMKI